MKKLILIALIATSIVACKKKTTEPTPVPQIQQASTLDTNYVTVKIKWTAPAGTTAHYTDMLTQAVLATTDTFQYRRNNNSGLQIDIITAGGIVAPLNYTICALSNKTNDTIINQSYSSISNRIGYSYVFN